MQEIANRKKEHIYYVSDPVGNYFARLSELPGWQGRVYIQFPCGSSPQLLRGSVAPDFKQRILSHLINTKREERGGVSGVCALFEELAPRGISPSLVGSQLNSLTGDWREDWAIMIFCTDMY